ncbi:MAG TPA: sensor histidine kinase [Solirubrobacteraceae bacterium]|nr:sensor histidine kinase [Solirubrobacteraceae bacterium]
MSAAADSEEGISPVAIWWSAAAALTLLLVVGAFIRKPEDAARSLVGIALGVGAVILVAGTRSSARLTVPVLPLAALSAAGLALDAGNNPSDIAWFGLCVLVFCSTLTAGRLVGGLFWFGSLVLLAASWIFVHHDLGWLPWMVGVTVCGTIAVLLLHERRLLLELREAQAGLAERSRAEERNRIARDLHDVIAHSLTVSLLHISSARLALQAEPEDAARALGEAERLGRESLDEVRSIVGLMRSPEADAAESLAPVPGLDAFDELVARFRSAGAEVELECSGDLTLVPATAGTTLYRIAQEALTNAVRHAPGSSVVVRVSLERDNAELVIDSTGRPGDGRGSGLESMRERAAALGGSCIAGPAANGWRVFATVPLPAGR